MITSVAKMLCWEFTFARSVYSPDYAALVDLSSPVAERGGEIFSSSLPRSGREGRLSG